VSLGSRLLVVPDPNVVAAEIMNRHQRYPYFRDCIGALDGSHIPASISTEEQAAAFRNRKGFLSQNVLFMHSFPDLDFK